MCNPRAIYIYSITLQNKTRLWKKNQCNHIYLGKRCTGFLLYHHCITYIIILWLGLILQCLMTSTTLLPDSLLIEKVDLLQFPTRGNHSICHALPPHN